MNPTSYLVKGADGNFYGPADLATLNKWAGEGRILADSVLVDEATQQQTLARDLPGLSHHFLGAPTQQAQNQPNYNPYQNPPAPMNSPYPRGANTPYNAVVGPRKSKMVAALLAFFLGGLGVHRFYLGHTTMGVVMLLVTIVGTMLCCVGALVMSVWAIIDMVLILTGQMKDANGQDLE